MTMSNFSNYIVASGAQNKERKRREQSTEERNRVISQVERIASADKRLEMNQPGLRVM